MDAPGCQAKFLALTEYVDAVWIEAYYWCAQASGSFLVQLFANDRPGRGRQKPSPILWLANIGGASVGNIQTASTFPGQVLPLHILLRTRSKSHGTNSTCAFPSSSFSESSSPSSCPSSKGVCFRKYLSCFLFLN